MNALIEQFRFGAPWWLLLLLVLPFLAWFTRRQGTPGVIIFSTLSVLASLGQKPKFLSGRLGYWLLLASILFGIMALARPQFAKTTVSRSASGIDIMLAIDVSGSMKIDDFIINRRRTSRIIAARNVAEDFISIRPDDRIGIIAFAGRPYVRSPITLDHEFLTNSLRDLRTGEISEEGTAIGSAVAAASTRLADREAKSKIVVLVTDGASNSGKITPEQAAKLAADLDIKVYTIGIGSESGRLRQLGYRQRQEFDVTALMDIAEITGAEFYRAKDTGSLIDVFETINQLEKTSVQRQESTIVDELFYIPALISALFAFITVILLAINPSPAP